MALVFTFVCSVIIRIIFVIISAVVIIVVVELSGVVAFGLWVFARGSVGIIQDQFAASEYRFGGCLPVNFPAISDRFPDFDKRRPQTDSPYRVRLPIHFVIGADISPQSLINSHDIL